MEIINKKVMVELKTGHKYFGLVTEIDNKPEYFRWIILKDDRTNKTQIINDSEVIRIEVLE